MGASVQIGPVPRGARREAMWFLVGGRRRDASVGVRAEAFERMAERSGGTSALWWARRGRRCVAAALVVTSPGRTGMLFHSPASADGVDARSLAAVIRGISRDALGEGVAFVQSLVLPTRPADADALRSAGYEWLAELVYLRKSLAGCASAEDSARYTWRDHSAWRGEPLARVIEATYADSLDCPALCGLRDLADVVAGHKASGAFCPESWWLVEHDGRDVGCILVNDSGGAERTMDVVYMGVVGEFRGRGLGRAMLRHAARWAARRGRRFLTVAVDAGNVHATRIYEAEGFRETDRRTAYILTADGAEAPET
jgi:mycothiol synthase